jgi:hypothetical protein
LTYTLCQKLRKVFQPVLSFHSADFDMLPFLAGTVILGSQEREGGTKCFEGNGKAFAWSGCWVTRCLHRIEHLDRRNIIFAVNIAAISGGLGFAGERERKGRNN